MVNVVLAGGGTAGHTSPLIATAEAIRGVQPDAGITCIGTAKGLETRVIPAAGLRLRLVDPVPLPRKPTTDLLKVPARLRRAVQQAGRILDEARADVLVGFGGYVAMPAYLAARQRRVPIVIHEQNAKPGLANRVGARMAARVLVTFPGTPLRRAEFVGLPLRGAITELAAEGRGTRRAAARASFGLAGDLFTLLVSGGSQGARSINTAVLGARDRLLAHGVQILHVWGPRNFRDDVASITDPVTGARYQPLAYVDAMDRAYAAADLMVGRSGAGTVVETATVGLPSLLVPLAIGNGEQARNAQALVNARAAILIPDQELTADRLHAEVTRLADDPGLVTRMGQAAQALMAAGAAQRVASIVLACAGGGQ